MDLKEQEKVWDEIAPEWHKYKKIPSEKSVEFLKSSKGNVLDLGGGSGRHMIKIKEGKYYLQDFSREMLELARDKANENQIEAEFIYSSMTEIPIEDDFFDSAICISALHCLKGEENRKKAVQELYRVLKRGAKAYIGVWNANSKRFNRKKGKELMIGWTNKGQRYYYLFEEKEVHSLFESVGFKILESHNSEMMINFIVIK
jgi:ubiquinone/menaquinone biosynthesis C-methylase UbiE